MSGQPALPGITIRPLTDGDRVWIRRFLRDHWGAEEMVVRETVVYPAELPGFVALRDGVGATHAPPVLGLITYELREGECEVLSLDSLLPGRGIGSALLARIETAAREAGARRLHLVTTNDNLHALRFYQKRGLRLAALRPGAVDRARRLKPEIPPVGNDDIPIRDELELEKDLPPDLGPNEPEDRP